MGGSDDEAAQAIRPEQEPLHLVEVGLKGLTIMEDNAAPSRRWPPHNEKLVDAWVPGRSEASSWGPYFSVFFAPAKVTPWVNFKRMSTGVNVARRLWDERESLRHDHEEIHGPDPDQWPARHPGVILESVKWIAHAACLGCQWLDRQGVDMRDSPWRTVATEAALHHQNSHRETHSRG